ncbi:aminopeptidase N [Nonomuraea sp. NPDC046802]|uniref:aminopeptidase N n=1 Tax=Nonomuraea sp. NPDC046802 TaxID=3154919 RepID=UPI0033C33817
MAGNLTRQEARERAGSLRVASYAVELDLRLGETRFRSVTTVRFSGLRPGATVFIDLHGAEIHKATLNGADLDISAYDAVKGRLPLPRIADDNELRLEATCAYSRTGEGLHRFVDPLDGEVYLYTKFQTADAHRVYACFDQPDLKAPFELTVHAPRDWKVVSNAAPDDVHDGRWHFPPTPAISTYVTALCAGPYHEVRSEHAGIPLGLYCRASLAGHLDADNLFELTRQGFDFFHKIFGIWYPFGKYDQLFVPEFNAGAMENAGCVTLQEDLLFRSRVTDADVERRAEVILHELAHMWFGDLVTMRWWGDLWLNESFATYASVLCLAEATRWGRGAWTTFAKVRKTWAYTQDQMPGTHPIAADIPDVRAVEVNFDGITYAKGAGVLKQLAAYVGQENFLAAVRDYFEAHKWRNTSLPDLLGALERTSGRDLSAWSRQWLESAGVNTLRPDFAVLEGRFSAFAVLQEARPEWPALRAHRIAIGLYTARDGVLRRTRRVELEVSGARTAVPELVGVERPDLVLLNDDDLGYAKVRLDEGSLATLLGGGVNAFEDPLPSVLCWSAAWDMTRDGELRARDYVSLVVSGLGASMDIPVLEALLTQARNAAVMYEGPTWRRRCLARLADALHAALAVAEPGSDRQLVCVRALISVAIRPFDLERLQGIRSGAAVPDGLAVDADLRWRLLCALVGGGRLGEADIAEESRRDPTSAGTYWAARCRAAVPTAEAKAATWAAIVSGALAGDVLRHTVDGFQDAHRPELLAPYRERYFAAVGRIYRDWEPDAAQTFALGCFPRFVVEPETVRAAHDYLAARNPPGPLARMILEGAGIVGRTLRNRAGSD